MKSSALVPDYYTFLTEVKGRIQSARIAAGRAVNRELVMLYWDIGHGIVEKQKTTGWGEAVVERLAADLRAEFPDLRGFSPTSIWLMRQFYADLSTPEFLEQAVQELNVLQEKLPAEFKGKLPTAKQLADAVREALPASETKRETRGS